MKAKTKLIMSIMSICLVCAVFAIGVFALKTANLKIGGDVSFTATGVEAHIRNAKIEGATTPTELDASDATGKYINTSMTQTNIDGEFDSWANMNLDFKADATDIVFSFDIANMSENVDDFIEIDYTASFSTEDSNAQYTFATQSFLLWPKGTATNATYQTVTITLSVADDELNIKPNTKFNLNISLNHQSAQEVTTTDNTNYVGGNLKYTLNGDHAEVTETVNNPTDIVIPAVVKVGSVYYPVATIWYGFSSGNATSVDIPNTVTAIYEGAFGGSSIKELTIPHSVSSIDPLAFANCSQLTSLYIGDALGGISVGSVGPGCSYLSFSGCTNLSSIIVSQGNRFLDGRNNCNAIISTATGELILGCKNTTLPNGITAIGQEAFFGVSLESITIPEGVISIGMNAFFNCTELSSVTLPNSLQRISEFAFNGCTRLEEIRVPKNVTIIGGGAFVGCTSLNSVRFEDSTSLWVSNDPNIPEEYRPHCIYSDVASTNATILKSDNADGFGWGFSKMETEVVGDYVFVTYNNTKYLVKYTGTDTELVLPTLSSNYEINHSVFYGNLSITSVVIPNCVTKIGTEAFRGCTGLTEITIPESVIEIAFAGTFYDCTNLKTVKIDSQEIAHTLLNSDSAGDLVSNARKVYIKVGFDVSGATYLTNTSNFTPEKVDGVVADADGDGYILYTKVA